MSVCIIHYSVILNSFLVCESESVQTSSGIVYVWPMTTPGNTANFTCPLNSDVVETRLCRETGWDTFDEEACGNSNEVSDQLNAAFNNVRHVS